MTYPSNSLTLKKVSLLLLVLISSFFLKTNETFAENLGERIHNYFGNKQSELDQKRKNFFDNLDYIALSNKISNWLGKSGESSAVTNVLAESEKNIFDDYVSLLTSSVNSRATGDSESYLLRFYWSSTEIGRGGLTVMCVLNIQYDRSTLVIDNCNYIDQETKDLTVSEWLSTARSKGQLIRPLSARSENVAVKTNEVIRFSEILKVGGTSVNLCREGTTNDFNILVVTGSEKQEFLDQAKTTFISRRLNFYGNKCFGIRVEKSGSVSSATEMRTNNLARNEGGQTIYPTVWTPASKVYESYAFGENGASRFIDGDPIVFSPMVFVFKKRHTEELSKIKHENLELLFSGESVDNSPLKDQNFMELPTVLGMTDILFRSSEKQVKIKPRGSYKLLTTPAKTSNSGFHYQVIQALEMATILQGGDPLDDLVYNIPNDILNSNILDQLIKNSDDRTRSSYESTNDLGEAFVIQSGIDGVFVYENVAIETILSLPESERENYQIVYPINNTENNHPAYILRNTSSPEQIEAAKIFLNFLRSREMQLLAMGSYGFRPLLTRLESEDGPLVDQNFGALESGMGVVSDLESLDLNFISVPPAGLVEKIIESTK